MVSTGTRRRLSFALGSWQIVALAAALDEADAQARAAPGGVDDVLVLYETGPVGAALVAAMHAVAGTVRPWRAVVEAFAAMGSVERRMSQAAYDAAQASLRAAVGPGRVDEIWLCRATRAAERLAIETWPEARVMLYEDGVLSYLPMLPLAPAGGVASRLGDALDARRPARRLARWKHAFDPRQFPRVAGAWMLLGDAFPAPATLASVPWHPVAAGRLRAAIDRCRAIPAVAAFRPAPTERPAVLMLGQALSRFHAMPRETELAAYRDAVTAIVAHGYDVWWKEHPRATEPFCPEVAAAVPAGRVRELELPFALPIELVADRLRLAACAGGITTALFYLPRLLGIPAYTVAGAFSAVLHGDWALQNRLFVERVAPLAELPPAASPPAPSA